MLFILKLYFASVDNRCKIWSQAFAVITFFYVLSCYGQSSGSSGLAFNRLSGKNSGFLKSTGSKTVSTAESLYLLYHYHVIIRDKE